MPRAFEQRAARLLRAAREHKPTPAWRLFQQADNGDWYDALTGEPQPVEADGWPVGPCILVTLARSDGE